MKLVSLRVLALAALCSFALISTTVYAGELSTQSQKQPTFRAGSDQIVLPSEVLATKAIADLNLLEQKLKTASADKGTPQKTIASIEQQIKQKLAELMKSSKPTNTGGSPQPAATTKKQKMYGIQFASSGKWEVKNLQQKKSA